MNPAIKLASALAASILLSGCLSLVVEQARIDADIPLAPPAVVPDSVKPGDFFLQASLKAGRTDLQVDEVEWRTDPVGGSLQMQFVGTRHSRVMAGLGYGGSPSAWIGTVWSARNSILRWDVEALFGATYAKSHLEGSVQGSDDEGGRVHDSLSPVDRRTLSGWAQFALRVRTRGSGPWAEWRILPGFCAGELSDPKGRVDSKAVVVAMDSWAAGWIAEFANRDMAILGARVVNPEADGFRHIQALAGWQKAF